MTNINICSTTPTVYSPLPKRRRPQIIGSSEMKEHHSENEGGMPDSSRKRKQLRIVIPEPILPSNNDASTEIEADELPSSLFSATSSSTLDSLFDEPTTPEKQIRVQPAALNAPSIPGLYFVPTLQLPQEIADDVVAYCMSTYFQVDGANQVMLFGRFIPPSTAAPSTESTSLPPVLNSLLTTLSKMLQPFLLKKTYSLLFPEVPTQARQVIINRYQPGEGISPHVDLLRRYGDGIIGVSFGSSCVMNFDKVPDQESSGSVSPAVTSSEKDSTGLFLPERSVIILSEDARYKWTHGIDSRTDDYVSVPPSECPISSSNSIPSGRWIKRGVRLSVTFRWLLSGADVVGPEEIHLDTEQAQ